MNDEDGKLGTEKGFATLQLMADNAMDWHDAIQTSGKPSRSVAVMTALLDAQDKMFRGRHLTKVPVESRILFNQWAFAYDTLFTKGCGLGVVPRDTAADLKWLNSSTSRSRKMFRP